MKEANAYDELRVSFKKGDETALVDATTLCHQLAVLVVCINAVELTSTDDPIRLRALAVKQQTKMKEYKILPKHMPAQFGQRFMHALKGGTA